MIIKDLYQLYKSSNKKNLSIFYLFFIIAFFILFLEFFSTAFLIGILLKLINNDTVIFNNDYLYNIEIFLKNLSLYKISLYTICIFAAKNILLLLFKYWQMKYSFGFQKDLSASLLKKICISDILEFQNDNSALKLRNIYTEVGWVRKLLTQVADLITEVFIIIGIISILIFYDPMFVLISILFFSVTIGLMYLTFFRKNQKWSEERIDLSGKLILNILQSLSSIKEIKIFRKIEKTVDYFQKNYTKYIKNAITHGLVKNASKPWIETLTIIFIFLIINFFLLRGVAQEEIISKLGIFFICIIRIMPSMLKVYNIVYTINFLKNSVALIKNELVDDEIYISEVQKERTENKEIKIQKVNVKNLSYKYPNTTKNVLNDLNFEFQKGMINTITGGSGTGKTTLLNIILGLLKIEKGEIFVNNINFTNKKLYENLNIGYVPQSIFLFDDTISNNISFIDESPNIKEKLEKASHQAEILNFVESLPDKFEHRIGEKASKISGGQMQRIGLARALYPNPDVIILDEFTSSVDMETEKKLMNTLQKLKKDKLIIIISHREQTIKSSDNIINLTNEKI